MQILAIMHRHAQIILCKNWRASENPSPPLDTEDSSPFLEPVSASLGLYGPFKCESALKQRDLLSLRKPSIAKKDLFHSDLRIKESVPLRLRCSCDRMGQPNESVSLTTAQSNNLF